MIEPGFEIFLGFILAIFSYFSLTQEIARIGTVFGIVIFVLATVVAISANDISGILINYAFFLLGAAFGAIGTAVFNGIFKPILERL